MGTQEYNRVYARETYHWRKAHGICTRCGKENAEPHKTQCAECAAKHAALVRKCWAVLDEEKRQETLRRKHELRTLSKTRGLCNCGKKAVKGRTHCLECALRRKCKSKMGLEAKRVKTDFSEGLCCRCNEPANAGEEALQEALRRCDERRQSHARNVTERKTWMAKRQSLDFQTKEIACTARDAVQAAPLETYVNHTSNVTNQGGYVNDEL